jgi:LuxR family transcriptional regulator, maltose regulon positive regulatory protein
MAATTEGGNTLTCMGRRHVQPLYKFSRGSLEMTDLSEKTKFDRRTHRHKTRVPRPLRSEMSRPELLTRLEDARGLKLVALLAPSGFGKTTLLAQFVRASSRRAIWLYLSEEEADPQTLATSLIDAVTDACPDMISPAQAEVPTAQALAAWFTQADDNVILVFDGIDVLTPDSGKWLHQFILLLPEGHQVLISGYSGAVLPLAKYVGEEQLLVLGAVDLAYSYSETAAYLHVRNNPQNPQEVHQALEGWPAGIALVTADSALHITPADLVDSALSTLPSALAASLPEVAILEVWNEEAAARLGCQLPAGWLKQVRQAGLPLTPLGKEDYRPHLVLTEVLEHKLKMQPERHSALHLLAARSKESEGSTVKAIAHYRLAGSNDAAFNLLRRLATDQRKLWQFYLTRRVLETFAQETLPADLLGELGQAFLETSDIHRGEELLIRLREERCADARALGALAGLANRRGKFDLQMVFIDEALGKNVSEHMRLGLLRMRAGALQGAGRLKEAFAEIEGVIEQAEAAGELIALSGALIRGQSILRVMGDLERSEATALRAIELNKAIGLINHSLPILDTLALQYLEQGRFLEAKKILKDALEHARSENHAMVGDLLETTGRLCFHLGDFAASVAVLEEAIALYVQSGFTLSATMTQLWKADVLLHIGDVDSAARLIARVVDQKPVLNSLFSSVLSFQQGVLCLMRDKLVEASILFESSLKQSPDAIISYRAENMLQRIGKIDVDAKNSKKTSEEVSESLVHPDIATIDLMFFNNHSILNVSTAHTIEISSLGGFECKVNSKPVKIPFRKAAELLLFLCIRGPSTKEVMINALWDGLNEKRNMDYIKVIIRRLRIIIKEHTETTNPIENRRGSYFLSDQLVISLDVLKLKDVAESGNKEIETLRRVFQSYKGDFLPGGSSEWLLEDRRLALSHTAAVGMRLGELLEPQWPQEAIAIYRHILHIDRLYEPAYLALARILQAIGDTTGSRHAYSEYARLMREEFDLPVLPEVRREFEA